MIQSFNTLTEEAQTKLFAHIKESNPEAFSDEHAMRKAYLGVPYDQGKTQFSYWVEGEVTGAIALVTKEVATKGEAFIHAAFINQHSQDAFRLLLAHALEARPTEGLRSTKLGLPPGRGDLALLAEAQGFQESYAMLELSYSGKPEVSVPKGFRVEPLTSSNKSLFREIINAAFENSQNGAILTEEEVGELVEDNAGENQIGLCFQDELPFGIYQLEHAGSVGWIDTIGIHPRRQGEGLGLLVLRHCLGLLQGTDIKLKVVSTNEKALRLYRRNGFGTERTIGVWFEKSGT